MLILSLLNISVTHFTNMRSLIIEVLFIIELRTMTSFIKYCELIALYSKCSGFLSRKIVKIYDFF